MKTTKMLTILVLGLMVCFPKYGEAEPMGTDWTYQGRLIDANNAADGEYDFQFKLFDDPCTGTQQGITIDINDVDVIKGYFTVELDFGSDVFDGDARWLEIDVRPSDINDPNIYTALGPRQEVTPTPYALHTYGLTVVGTNTFIGKYAGTSNTTGFYNTFSGNRAGYSNTTGQQNTFTGNYAGYSNIMGNENTFTGDYAGYSNKTGYYNTFTGKQAGYSNTTGHYNTFSGNRAGYSNTIGHGNTFSGYQAGHYNTAGGNTFTGKQAGYFNTTGVNNTFSGALAGYSNTLGRYNTFSGAQAGYSNTRGDENTFSGYQAGYSNTLGNENTFSGYKAGYFNTTGFYNTFSGTYAGCYNTEGSYNTFTGKQAGYSNTTGRQNTFSGYQAGRYNTEGSYNTFSGYQAGYSNIKGHGNVFIGYSAGFNEKGSNKLFIANSDTSVPLIYGDFTTGRVGLGTRMLSYRLQLPNTADAGGQAQANAWRTYSSRRWKTNIQPIEDALEKVQRLRGVYFDWKSNSKHDIGLIAEEVGKVLPEIVDYEENGIDTTSMDYSKLTPLLVEAVKSLKMEVNELQRQNAEKDGVIDTLKQQNDKLEGRLAVLESSITTITVQLKRSGK